MFWLRFSYLPLLQEQLVGSAYFNFRKTILKYNTDAFIFACVPVIYFYASLYFKANSEEKTNWSVAFYLFW